MLKRRDGPKTVIVVCCEAAEFRLRRSGMGAAWQRPEVVGTGGSAASFPSGGSRVVLAAMVMTGVFNRAWAFVRGCSRTRDEFLSSLVLCSVLSDAPNAWARLVMVGAGS